MSVIKPIKAPEQSTVKVVVEFSDPEDGSAITPATATWTLMDINGNVINSRSGVSLTPASSITLYLSGADLQIVDDTKSTELRLLAVEGTYNNGVAVVPIRQEFQFEVENLLVTS